MIKINANLFISIIGILFVSIGYYLNSHPEISAPLIGIGASILATSICNVLISTKINSLPFSSIIEALAQKTEFIRKKHEAELTFTLKKKFVRLDRIHKYNLSNPSHYKRSRNITLFTDLSTFPSLADGGFTCVIGPDGTTLEGTTLNQYVTIENGKHIFRKIFDLQPGDNNSFEFRSYENYRLIDRLSWTVQDLSENFRVRIKNLTGKNDAFNIKINHHREASIVEQIKYITSPNEILIDFNTEVLPYQGFEVFWDLS
jgi:hypothetical protein